MNRGIIHPRFYIFLLHIVMGYMMTLPVISKSLNILLLFVGFMSILYYQNKNNEAMIWSAYIVGSEVLFRMSGGTFLYETSKYLVFIFLITGMIIERRKHAISQVYVLYLLLLLLGIAFSDIPFPDSIRKNVIFNLSGPILVGISALYFYRRKIDLSTVLKSLYFIALPLVSMLVYLYFNTVDLTLVEFNANSNYQASGGYGPNQVSTILSLGIFCTVVHLYYKRTISGYVLVDILMIMYLVYRVLITLSRGGFITALVALGVFSLFYLLVKKNAFILIFRYTFLVFGITAVIWTYASEVTDGMLYNRYTNRNTIGESKGDISTGRFQLMEHEFKMFLENPFFGVGVGTGKFLREEEIKRRFATHNEMSRLLAEHGAIGLLILFLLIVVPVANLMTQPMSHRAFLAAFLVIWFLTINHSAMRLAMPAFMYGLTVMIITRNHLVMIEDKYVEEETIEKSKV